MRVAAINLVVADQPGGARQNLSANWEHTDAEGALHDFNLEVR